VSAFLGGHQHATLCAIITPGGNGGLRNARATPARGAADPARVHLHESVDLLVPGETTEGGRQAIEALTYGLLNFGLWYVVLVDVLLPRRESDPWIFRFGVVGVLVVSPNRSRSSPL
jgi:hypothetical protein